MKFLFASDSFKGTLSSARIAELLTTAAKESFPDCTCTSIETADGGEGTTDAVLSAVQGQRIPLVVCGPLWKKTDCFYGKLDEERAVMEMAAASGLPLLTEPERDPEKTTTYGTGEMILDALDRGFRDISIAIGGSATNDGGMGCMCALGVRFLDENGEILQGCGENLVKFLKLMFPVWIQELQRQNSQSCVMSIIRSVGKMEQPIHSVHKREEPRRV